MKKNIKIGGLILAFIMISAVVLCACPAQAETPQYRTVKFISFDAEIFTVAVPDGSVISALSKIEKEGFEFTGWLNGENPHNFDAAVTSDLTLTANWAVKAFAVTFANCDLPGTSVAYGQPVQRPDNPVKEGKIFLEWLDDGKPYGFDKPVYAPLTLTAAWRDALPNEPVFGQIDLDFDDIIAVIDNMIILTEWTGGDSPWNNFDLAFYKYDIRTGEKSLIGILENIFGADTWMSGGNTVAITGKTIYYKFVSMGDDGKGGMAQFRFIYKIDVKKNTIDWFESGDEIDRKYLFIGDGMVRQRNVTDEEYSRTTTVEFVNGKGQVTQIAQATAADEGLGDGFQIMGFSCAGEDIAVLTTEQVSGNGGGVVGFVIDIYDIGGTKLRSYDAGAYTWLITYSSFQGTYASVIEFQVMGNYFFVQNYGNGYSAIFKLEEGKGNFGFAAPIFISQTGDKAVMSVTGYTGMPSSALEYYVFFRRHTDNTIYVFKPASNSLYELKLSVADGQSIVFVYADNETNCTGYLVGFRDKDYNVTLHYIDLKKELLTAKLLDADTDNPLEAI
ncbi:MAG: InlB B-repeat-containing protein [Firmicutes bacterium]|nr:InlB B-repeat-containing protein [Bacillota bacterium]